MRVGTFDIETDGLLAEATTVWCATIKDHYNGSIRRFDPSSISELPSYLDRFNILIGHNCVQFDFPVLKKVFGWEYKGQVRDTLLMSRLQSPHRGYPQGYVGGAPHGVEAWGYRLGLAKQEHNEWDGFSPAMMERCVQDVEIQYKIYEELLHEGRERGWDSAHRLNVKIFQHLQEQEEYGFRIDREHLNDCVNTLDRWIDRINSVLVPHLPYIVEPLETKKDGVYGYVSKPFKRDGNLSAHMVRFLFSDTAVSREHNIVGPFSRITIRPVDLDSTIEIKAFLLEQGWQPEQWNEKNGQRTSAKLSKDDPFKGIQSALGRLVAKRIQCRQRRSVLEGWNGIIRKDCRLSTAVGGIATTGRLRHKVVVNIPSPHSRAFFARQMRQCFIATPGWAMVGVDSKGNQMRQLAGRMGDEEFTNAVLHGTQDNGTDLHSLNQKRSGAATRTLAKNFFYGSILFGAGDTKTAQLLETTKQQAKKIKEDYMAGMPKLKAVIDGLIKEWRLTAKHVLNRKWNRVEYYEGYIKGADGRPVLVPYEKDLLCYALQSDEAIHMGVAYVMIHKWAKVKGWEIGRDWGMLVWMHDEFQMECRPEIAEELGKLACYAIKWAGEWLKIGCPHDGDYLIGRNWYETH
jgi:DNA polymerase-1